MPHVPVVSLFITILCHSVIALIMSNDTRRVVTKPVQQQQLAVTFTKYTQLYDDVCPLGAGQAPVANKLMCQRIVKNVTRARVTYEVYINESDNNL